MLAGRDSFLDIGYIDRGDCNMGYGIAFKSIIRKGIVFKWGNSYPMK